MTFTDCFCIVLAVLDEEKKENRKNAKNFVGKGFKT